MKIETHGLEFLSEIKYPDLEIPSQKVSFICGESGCGKSSLLKLINQTANASRGKILYDGQETISTNEVELRKKILLVSQNVFLFEGTIKENFAQFYEYRNETIICDEEIKHYLDICQLDFPLDSKCEKMSGGERQRVFLAICLSLHPDTLMLDEPTSALDEKTAENVMQNMIAYIREKGITLIVVSHDSALSKKWAEQIILLERGKENE